MDGGEVAHIEAVSDSYNNSPDNLIYLCPNHHTKYDLGYRPSKNVTPEMVRAAKLLKRKSRQRMMAYEANAVKGLHGLIQLIKSIGTKLKDDEQKDGGLFAFFRQFWRPLRAPACISKAPSPTVA